MPNTDYKKAHPLVLGAAASVMVVSLLGAAAIAGLLPNARSEKTDITGPGNVPVAVNGATVKQATREIACASCGKVESIRAVQLKGDATGLGAVAGGVTGAVVGNQIGRGHGNTAMTLLGAAGGAFAGNEIEKNVKKHYSYRVMVRMDDGSSRTISQSTAPAVAAGDRVRIVNGALVAES